MSRLGNKLTDITIGEALLAIVIGWLLVAVWQRFIDNLFYNTLGLSKSSAYSTFVVATSITVFFIAFITIFGLINVASANSGLEPI